MAQKPFPNLPADKMEDIYVREATNQTLQYFRDNSPLFGFQHFELTIKTNGTELEYEHGLAYLPKDILVTSVVNGTITWLYSQFTKKKLVYSATGIVDGTPCVIRFFAGSYVENL